MNHVMQIEPQDGSILIGSACRLRSGQHKADIERNVSRWLNGSINHGNGYEWLNLRGLTFGGCDAALGLCFKDKSLSEASWSVSLPDAPMESRWPTREAIDAEIEFVRSVLVRDIGFKPHVQNMTFSWGEVWCSFDPKGFLASNGLRYRAA